MRLRLLVAAVAAAALATPALPGSAAPPPKSFDYTKVKGLSAARFETEREAFDVPMRDGVKIYVEVVRPTKPGRYGTILELSPYHGTLADRAGTRILPEPEDEDGNKIGLAGYFAPRGYAVVFADLRGTGRSQGCLDHMGRLDQGDSFEIVEWAAKQPWSNGRVGMTGHSYVGSTPSMAAAMRPPHLVTIVPSAGIAAMYHHEFQGGVPYSLQWAGPLFAYEQLALERFAPDGDDPPPNDDLTYAGCGWTQSAAVTGEAYFSGQEVRWHRDRDWRAKATGAPIPVFMVHGIHDNAARIPGMDWFNARRRAGDKAWIGQWRHDPGGNRDVQWTRAIHAWFDRHLLQRKVATGPPVEVFLNDETVLTPKVWPPAAQTLTLDALSGDALAKGRAEPSTVSYIADATGGTDTARGAVAFTTEPVTQETVVVGVPQLRLSVSIIGASRLHLNATLYDVDDTDSVRPMAQATWAIQPELRNGLSTVTPVVPGQLMTIKLTGMNQAYVLAPGHKLRLVVASSHPDKVPTFAAGAQVTIHLGGANGTQVSLPVLRRPARQKDIAPPE